MYFCWMKIKITLHCPDCQGTKIKKNGRKSYGKQNYLVMFSKVCWFKQIQNWCKKSGIESFKMIEQFLWKTAGFTECPPDTVSQPAVIALYACRIFLPHRMVFTLKCYRKAIPVTGGCIPVAYPWIRQFFLQFFRCFQVPFSPYKRHGFTGVSMVCMDEPYLMIFCRFSSSLGFGSRGNEAWFLFAFN